jgi:hypothetical protein
VRRKRKLCRVLTDDQASCLLTKMHAPITKQLPAKPVPSAETSGAPSQTWLFSPTPGARPRTHEIPLLTSGLPLSIGRHCATCGQFGGVMLITLENRITLQ